VTRSKHCRKRLEIAACRLFLREEIAGRRMASLVYRKTVYSAAATARGAIRSSFVASSGCGSRLQTRSAYWRTA
jgi:hypothetical protein